MNDTRQRQQVQLRSDKALADGQPTYRGIRKNYARLPLPLSLAVMQQEE